MKQESDKKNFQPFEKKEKKRKRLLDNPINEQNRSNVSNQWENKKNKIKEAHRIFILKFHLKCDKYFNIFM